MKKRKYRFRRSLHISTLLTLSITSVAIIGILVTGFALSKIFSNYLKKYAIESNKEIISQVNKNIEFYFSDIISAANYIKSITEPDAELTPEKIRLSMEILKDSHRDVTGIGIFDTDGNTVIATSEIVQSNRGISNEEWFKKAKQTDDYSSFFFSLPHRQNLTELSVRDSVISYSCPLRIRGIDGNEKKAILLIDLNLLAISKITEHALSDYSDESYAYLITDSGEIVYHPQMQKMVYGFYTENTGPAMDTENRSSITETPDGGYFTVIEPIENTDWKIIGVESLRNIRSNTKSFRNVLIISYSIISVITIVISQLMARYITEPIRELEEKMREVQNGNFSISPSIEGTKEVRSLSSSFSIMIDKIKGLMNDIKHTEEVKRQRELDALQAKINPHFLYNTLETVVWLAETGNNKGVVRTVTSLASLFRISIAKGHDIITLQEELEYVRNYIEIQMMRYKDKFDYTITIPDNLKNCPTIKLIVQPVVENSIYHGIKYLQEKGHITIEAADDGNDIVVKVSDNGVGMDKRTAAELLNPNADIERSGNGIGLINIDERLKLSYGDKYGLSIWSELDEGTSVTIRIPHLPPITPILIRSSGESYSSSF